MRQSRWFGEVGEPLRTRPRRCLVGLGLILGLPGFECSSFGSSSSCLLSCEQTTHFFFRPKMGCPRDVSTRRSRSLRRRLMTCYLVVAEGMHASYSAAPSTRFVLCSCSLGSLELPRTPNRSLSAVPVSAKTTFYTDTTIRPLRKHGAGAHQQSSRSPYTRSPSRSEERRLKFRAT
jgi:hypothetical protein